MRLFVGKEQFGKIREEKEMGFAFYSPKVIPFSAEDCVKGCMCAQPHAQTPRLPDARLKPL